MSDIESCVINQSRSVPGAAFRKENIMTVKTETLDVIFEGGESLNHPGKAADYMIVRRERDALYAERLVEDRFDANDDFDHYDDLLADILGQAEEEGMIFDAVKVNGKAISIRATFNVPSVYADYFDDADVCADSVSELEEKLNAMQEAADQKMQDALQTKKLTAKDYELAPTYASMAQTEWVNAK